MTSRSTQLTLCLLAVVATGALAACGSSTDEQHATKDSGFPLSFTRCGQKMTFTHRPRVLVDQPYAANVVAQAGGNRAQAIVALTNVGNQSFGPDGADLDDVKRLSPTQPVSTEVLVSLRPDLIVTHGLTQADPDNLAALGIQTMVVNVCCGSYAAAHGGHTDFNAMYDDIQLLGQLLGTERYAARTITAMQSTVASVSAQARSFPKRTVAIIGTYSGMLYALPDSTMSSTVLRTLGLTNVYADLPAKAPYINIESLIAKNPDVIVLEYVGEQGQTADTAVDAFTRLPGADELAAVRRDGVITIDSAELDSLPGPSSAVPGPKALGAAMSATTRRGAGRHRRRRGDGGARRHRAPGRSAGRAEAAGPSGRPARGQRSLVERVREDLEILLVAAVEV